MLFNFSFFKVLITPYPFIHICMFGREIGDEGTTNIARVMHLCIFTVLMFAIIRQCILCSVSSSYRAFSLSFNNLQVHVCYRYPKDVNEDLLKR